MKLLTLFFVSFADGKIFGANIDDQIYELARKFQYLDNLEEDHDFQAAAEVFLKQERDEEFAEFTIDLDLAP